MPYRQLKISRAFEANYGINPETRLPYASHKKISIDNCEVIGYVNLDTENGEEYFTPVAERKKEILGGIISALQQRKK